MPDSPQAARIAVTIPKANADAFREELRAWGGVASARILGLDDHDVAMYVALLTSPLGMSLGFARPEIETRVRRHGGVVGAKDAWLIKDDDLGDFLDEQSMLVQNRRELLSPLQQLFLVAAAEVSEEDTDRRMEARAVTARFDFGQPSDDWLFEATKNLASLGFIAPYQRDGTAGDQFVHLTAAGIRKARALVTAGVRVHDRHEEGIGSPHSDGSNFSDGSGYAPTLPIVPPVGDTSPIDSSRWTGVNTSEVVEGHRLEQLREHLTILSAQVDGLDHLSNIERQQVMTIVTALKILADAPEPPANAIRELLQVLNNISGIASLMVAIVALMSS